MQKERKEVIMRGKKIFGLAALILGVLLLFGGLYVQNEVKKGRGQIAQAERGVGAASRFLSHQNKRVKKYGGKAVGYVEGKIREGKMDADFYQKVSYFLYGSGGVLGLIGIIFLCKKKAS